MALSARAKTVIRSLAKRGDYLAQAAYEAGGVGFEQQYTFTDVPTADIDWFVADNGDDTGAAGGDMTIINSGTVAIPRNITVTAGASYAGGKIHAYGTDQFGNAVDEEITPATGTLTAGSKIFKTITRVTKELDGAGGAGHNWSLGFGTKIGLPVKLSAQSSVQCRLSTGAAEAVTLDTTYSAFTPTNVPDASRDYIVTVGGV